MRTNRSREGGFTLLEILIAVLIVGIMATAVVPMMGTYNSQARAARLMSDGNNLIKAMERYTFEHATAIGTVVDPADPSITNVYLDSSSDPELSLYTQLLNPTDKNGNPMNEPAFAGAGPFSYGPYLDHKPRPASLLIGAANTGTIPGQTTAIHMYFVVESANNQGVRDGVRVGRINLASVIAQNNGQNSNGRATNLCEDWPIEVTARCDQWAQKTSTLYPGHALPWDSNDARPVIAPITRGPANGPTDYKATDGPFGVRLVYYKCTTGGTPPPGNPQPGQTPIPGCKVKRQIAAIAFNPSLRGGVVNPEGPPIDNLDLLEGAVTDICTKLGAPADCIAEQP
jgi:prepilin-type N-terminal cleavage/methylation domain-containing protein